MKILAVGSHPALLAELCVCLSALFPNADVQKEMDALLAGKYVFNYKVDLLIAEVGIRRMNGVQLCQFARKEQPNVCTCVIGTEEELLSLLPADDVDHMLEYPCTVDSLRAALLGRNGRGPSLRRRTRSG